jgi:hypothetical protein
VPNPTFLKSILDIITKSLELGLNKLYKGPNNKEQIVLIVCLKPFWSASLAALTRLKHLYTPLKRLII